MAVIRSLLSQHYLDPRLPLTTSAYLYLPIGRHIRMDSRITRSTPFLKHIMFVFIYELWTRPYFVSFFSVPIDGAGCRL